MKSSNNLLDSYDFMKDCIGSNRLEELLVKAIQVSDAISQDVQDLKYLIVRYAEDTLDETLIPRFALNTSKTDELENGQIQASQPPSFFYPNLGIAVSKDVNSIFDGLVQGWLIVQTLVHLFLGASNARKFCENFNNASSQMASAFISSQNPRQHPQA
ncbi:hypothetical protein D9757_004938 [Collybiopsis confluens]|uniref:Uncharacterized protein n=1 Tax=Collybiopsis confluens TaxID=2823264 RepID=A0A8H5HT86_9AGAR|nr:hypothetical protein D9757_014649 [Collybiopsis confluens]KAF5389080.1 hypothetical protein D9757_004938 [Collybiopsis confluens]